MNAIILESNPTLYYGIVADCDTKLLEAYLITEGLSPNSVYAIIRPGDIIDIVLNFPDLIIRRGELGCVSAGTLTSLLEKFSKYNLEYIYLYSSIEWSKISMQDVLETKKISEFETELKILLADINQFKNSHTVSKQFKESINNTLKSAFLI